MATVELAPSVLVVFGATGDLMSRKVVPSLFHLFGRGELPERSCVVGCGRREWTDDDLRHHVRSILAERAPSAAQADVERFTELFRYHQGLFDEDSTYDRLKVSLDGIEGEWGSCPNKLFYLAVPPDNYENIFRRLAGHGLTTACSEREGWTRVLVEKPFGDDEETARALDTLLGSLFREEQIYRIDHYLAKEMLQGIMNFRFTNNLFEAEWNRDAIERIDISLLEEIGVEKRGAFYDKVGALRDVGQNHLLQMLALVTMDQPSTAGADDIREARAALIDSLPMMTPGEVATSTYRAQYEGYRAIAGVAEDSATETYFKMRFVMRGHRWAGVPVTMESGKRVGPACKRIVVTFRRPRAYICEGDERCVNSVVFTLEPQDRIEIVFHTKKPGFEYELEERTFSFFLYERAEKAQYVEEYAKLLFDAFRGDQTLFVSTREVDAGWRFIDPVVDAWSDGATPLDFYTPDASDVVSAADAFLDQRAVRGRLGVAGLGKMGAGLARNLMDHGWQVMGWNRTHAVAEEMSAEGLLPAVSLADLVGGLEPPRVVWLMVPAGAPVDELLFGGGDSGEGLAQLLAPGDIVIDGGNSRYTDAAGRADRLAANGVHFVDCGTSGGPSGARHGATLMVGGDREVFDFLEPMLACAAAPGAYRHFPGHGAGHFVKMVHNGIEYGMMQAIAEGFALLHASEFELDLEEVADLYQHRSVIESRLVGWLEGAYAKLGDDLEGVSGVVGHSGEGEWTVEAAKAAGIEVPVIEESLEFRKRSAERPGYAGQVLTAMRDAFGGHGLGPGGGPRT